MRMVHLMYGFVLKINKIKNHMQIRVRNVFLTVRETGVSYFGIMQSISNVLNVILNITQHNDGVQYYLVTNTNPN